MTNAEALGQPALEQKRREQELKGGGSSRDESCPNKNPSVDDATGYSKEEEEALEAEVLSEGEEEEVVSSW